MFYVLCCLFHVFLCYNFVMTIQFDEEKQDKKIDVLRKREEEDLVQMLSSRYSLPYIDLSPIPINMEALRLIPEEKARSAKMAGFNVVGKKLDIALFSPNLEGLKDVVKTLEQEGYLPTLHMTSMQSLEKAWSKYKDLSFATETKAGSLEISAESIAEFVGKVSTIRDVETLVSEAIAEKKIARISRVLEIILAGAISTNASDIHFEPEEKYVRLRYRLDGVLNDVTNFDRETFALILSRVKLLSGLKLNIKNSAQDGRFSVHLGKNDTEIRTSLLPGAYSESIVLRILNPEAIAVPLEELGIESALYEILIKEIKKPNGMLLTTGPTGSGKTTTLYAFLRQVHTVGVKIITIEDPIEYHMPGIVQTQVNPEKGYTFLEGLRSALRQDPDVIMVGEIRDKETASIAINSALTGHLVFSTLHTNNAAGAFPRLIDLGINPKIMTSAVNVAMAQRLVRKLCPSCKKEIPLEGKEKQTVEQIFATIKNRPGVKLVEKIWRAEGCDKCSNTGYKGRIGIFEAILSDEMIAKVVTSNPSEREIEKSALGQGILNMKQDGILKVLAGITDLTELERVIDLGEHR